MTTHYMEEAENCQYISIMDQGKIIAEGSPEHLKSCMEGDQIHLQTVDDTVTKTWLEEQWNLKISLNQDGLEFVLPHGDTELAKLISTLPNEVRRLTVRQPTLEDVFLKLTGRQIRDEESGTRDRLRLSAQRKGKL